MKFATIAVSAAAALIPMAALAHHSYGMFDRQKEQKIVGTVKEFQWTNPHSRLEVTVAGEAGALTDWTVEMGPPGQLVRSGWKRLSLKPGDKVEVLVNPLRDGAHGGHLLMLTTPSGQDLYDVVFRKPPQASAK